MTENEMRERMKEIDKEREHLKSERQKYEKYFSDKEIEELLSNHIKFEGKCFLTKKLPGNEYNHIKSFKIIKVLSEPNEHYAECIAVIDGCRSSCWNEFGIQAMTLPLWTPNKLRLMSRESEPKVIDMYEEITQEKFASIYRKYKQEIEENITK